MNNNLKYSIIVPVYNEELILPYFYRRLKGVLNELDGFYEVIFVNDGSKDSSEHILKDIAGKDYSVVIIKFKKNFGQHAAVIAGILNSFGDFVITLDADLQNPPEEIPRLINEINQGYDMVSGKRSNRKDTIFRKISSFIASITISLFAGIRIYDPGSMLRVFKADTAKRIANAFLRKQVYITMIIPSITKNTKEIDVSHDSRMGGPSKYGLFRLLKMFLTIFCARTKDSKEDLSDTSNIFSIESIIKNGKTV